ncbi:MAG TPA: ABC transporter permease [Bryobacteraceae bacterium]|nr:ABC transporter permease [Bryobacteraceae bacterium]
MFPDLKFGLKLLWKEKAFTLTALATLALCIGANTAIFTVLHAVVLDPLPFAEPDRLVSLYNLYPGVGVSEYGANGVPDYLDRKQMTDVFDSVALIGNRGYDVGAAGSPVRIDGNYVTPSFFRVLRASPMLGRAFTEEDATFGNDKFAILSYGLWKDMFARDRNVLGKDIRLSGVPYRIVGVMPASFEVQSLGTETKVWVPFAFEPRQTTDDARHNKNWGMVARLKPGVTVAYAQRRIDAINKHNIERFPKFRKLLEDAGFCSRVVGLKDELVKSIRATLYLLQAAVAFVLFIGCVNVANLMLVRSSIRMKEMAIRFSLGAGRWRLARQLLTESVTVAVLGGSLGLLVGLAGIRLLAYLGAKDLPRGHDLHMDGAVLAVTAAVAVLTGLVFGSVPVFHLYRRDLNDIFRQTGRTGTSERRAVWTRSALVVCQVSLAFILLIGSGLLTLSFARLLSVRPGFQPQHVFTAQFSLPDARYKDDARVRNLEAALLENIRALPGVTAAGATTFLPFSNSQNASVTTVVGHNLAPGENPPVPAWNTVDTGYFRAMGIPLLQGRVFEESDADKSLKVAIIDQFLARKYWPAGSAIGGKVQRGIESNDPVLTVVGVVGIVKTGNLAEQNPVGQVYIPYKQDVARTMHLVVKTNRDDPQLSTAIRREILQADPELPLFDIKTMPERLSASVLSSRAAMILCLIFGGLALALSAIGIYGVLAYTVTQRTREFGIRVALGATVRDILGTVLGKGLRLAGIGLGIGIAAALALTRLMTTLLYDVKPTDPVVFLIVAAALGLVALFASLLPSLRAVRIQPASALRDE